MMMFELDESDLWNAGVATSPEFRDTAINSRNSRRFSGAAKGDRRVPGSLPVNVPDWSKILKDEYRENRRSESDEDEDDGEDRFGNRIPPHELLARRLARTRIASYSLHEGIGRTLKGRDLSRVRNAIFEKTGFQD